MLNAAELAAMRDTVDAALPDTCTIQTKSRTTTAAGNTYTYTTVAADVPCKWVPLSAREALLAHQLGQRIDGKVRLAADQAVTLAHRLLIDGTAYEVIATNVDHAWRLQTLVMVVRVSLP
jgi:SPP1 family predicted phage head-tail adaptor